MSITKACGSWSPHAPTVQRVGNENRQTPVQCNRPFGHEGNHAFSTMRVARMYEWTRAEVVR